MLLSFYWFFFLELFQPDLIVKEKTLSQRFSCQELSILWKVRQHQNSCHFSTEHNDILRTRQRYWKTTPVFFARLVAALWLVVSPCSGGTDPAYVSWRVSVARLGGMHQHKAVKSWCLTSIGSHGNTTHCWSSIKLLGGFIPMTAVVMSCYVEFARFFHVSGPPKRIRRKLVIWSIYHWIYSDRIGIFKNLTHRLGISNILGNHTWTFHRFKLTSYIHVYDWNTHRFQSSTMVFRYWVARSMINGSFEQSFEDFHWISKD